MKVFYLIQTYKNLEQIYRLVQILKKSSPASHILVSHNFTTCNLDTTLLKKLPGVEVLRLSCKGGRGNFSIIQGYLDAIEWLFSHNIEFDWLINLSGQDYPTQPLPQIEKFLAETKCDGFLKYFEVFSNSKHNPWGIKASRNRYLYQYWRSGVYVSRNSLSDKLLKRLVPVFHTAQPFIRLDWILDSLRVGVLATSNPFNEKFLCYGVSYFHTLPGSVCSFCMLFTSKMLS